MAAMGRVKTPLQSKVFFYGLLFLFIFLAWILFRPFLLYIATGLLVSILALPIDRKWEKILPNKVAAFGTLLTIFILIVGPIVGLGFAIYSDVSKLVGAVETGQIRDIIVQVAEFVRPNMDEQERIQWVNQIYLDTIQPWILSATATVASSALTLAVQLGVAITVILFVVYYILTDGDRLLNYMARAVPLPARQMQFLMKEAHNGLEAVFYGQLMTSLIQGALGGVGFLIAGVPGAIVWAGVMAVLSLIPVIGPPVIWVPAAILLIVQGQVGFGIFLIVWGVVVVAQVDNIVRPILIGSRADIHPLFVLIGALGGVVAFGFIGLFLGPLLVGVTVSVLKVWETDYIDPEFLKNRQIDAHIFSPEPKDDSGDDPPNSGSEHPASSDGS
jgi:predicted PurR-regulated permease PerM